MFDSQISYYVTATALEIIKKLESTMHYALRNCIGQTRIVTVNNMLVRLLQVLSARVQVNTVYIGYATATVNRDMRGLIFSI